MDIEGPSLLSFRFSVRMNSESMAFRLLRPCKELAKRERDGETEMRDRDERREDKAQKKTI